MSIHHMYPNDEGVYRLHDGEKSVGSARKNAAGGFDWYGIDGAYRSSHRTMRALKEAVERKLKEEDRQAAAIQTPRTIPQMPRTTPMSIGYIGLGNMGGALARRLALTHPLRVFDLRPEAMQALSGGNCIPVQSAAALGAECGAVLTCLPTSADVRRAVLGPGGLAEGMGAGGIVLDQTTGDPNETRAMAAELSERGIRLIDAPVSGGKQGANAGTIAIMVGAADADYAEALPLLRAISPNVFHCGGVGAGHVMKLVNNVVAAAALAASCEALAMGVKNGLDFARAVEVLNKGSGRSFMSERVLAAQTEGPHPLEFAIGLMHKDVRLATRLGADSAAPMFVATAVRELHQAAIAHIGPEADVTELMRTVERNADVRVLP